MAKEDNTKKKEEQDSKEEKSDSTVKAPVEKKDETKKDKEKADDKKEEKADKAAKPRLEKAGDKEVSTPAVTKAKEKTTSKAAKTEQKEVSTLEREYIVPLRKGSAKVPAYKRAKKAIKTLKEFIAKHMRVENRDLRKVKIDMDLNNEIWFRGIKKPASKIKVKAAKNVDGTVSVTLSELPDHVKFAKARRDKQALKASMAKIKGSGKKGKAPEEEKTEEEKQDTKEKEKASVEAGKARQKQDAKTAKHTAKGAHKEKTAPQRKSLKK